MRISYPLSASDTCMIRLVIYLEKFKDLQLLSQGNHYHNLYYTVCMIYSYVFTQLLKSIIYYIGRVFFYCMNIKLIYFYVGKI